MERALYARGTCEGLIKALSFGSLSLAEALPLPSILNCCLALMSALLAALPLPLLSSPCGGTKSCKESCCSPCIDIAGEGSGWLPAAEAETPPQHTWTQPWTLYRSNFLAAPAMYGSSPSQVVYREHCYAPIDLSRCCSFIRAWCAREGSRQHFERTFSNMLPSPSSLDRWQLSPAPPAKDLELQSGTGRSRGRHRGHGAGRRLDRSRSRSRAGQRRRSRSGSHRSGCRGRGRSCSRCSSRGRRRRERSRCGRRQPASGWFSQPRSCSREREEERMFPAARPNSWLRAKQEHGGRGRPSLREQQPPQQWQHGQVGAWEHPRPLTPCIPPAAPHPSGSARTPLFLQTPELLRASATARLLGRDSSRPASTAAPQPVPSGTALLAPPAPPFGPAGPPFACANRLLPPWQLQMKPHERQWQLPLWRLQLQQQQQQHALPLKGPSNLEPSAAELDAARAAAAAAADVGLAGPEAARRRRAGVAADSTHAAHALPGSNSSQLQLHMQPVPPPPLLPPLPAPAAAPLESPALPCLLLASAGTSLPLPNVGELMRQLQRLLGPAAGIESLTRASQTRALALFSSQTAAAAALARLHDCKVRLGAARRCRDCKVGH